LSIATGVPYAFHMAGIALVMTASVLVPVRPIDGGWVAPHRPARVAGALLLAAAVLLML
jgi:hypothetical protein